MIFAYSISNVSLYHQLHRELFFLFFKVFLAFQYCLIKRVPTSSSVSSSSSSTTTTQQQQHHHHHCIVLFLHTLTQNTLSLQTLAEAIEVAGLADALSGGSFTIFAPTDNAFLEYFDAAKTTKEAFLVTITLSLSLILSQLMHCVSCVCCLRLNCCINALNCCVRYLCLLARFMSFTYRQNYENLFHVVILSKHHHHHQRGHSKYHLLSFFKQIYTHRPTRRNLPMSSSTT
jgi:hypothetical protein